MINRKTVAFSITIFAILISLLYFQSQGPPDPGSQLVNESSLDATPETKVDAAIQNDSSSTKSNELSDTAKPLASSSYDDSATSSRKRSKSNRTEPNAKPANNLTLAKLTSSRPIEVKSAGYIGSESCIECHDDQHSSWSSSFHRTMTQVATPETVMGDFDNVSVTSQGKDYFLSIVNGVCTVSMPDEKDPTKRVTAPVVMTTGSHHMQVYWFATGQSRLLGMLPLVFLQESNEWIPRESAFLVPPHTPASFELGRWNEACSSCHSTHRKERRLASGQWDTHVGEFGISCEACHGPAEQHVLHQRATRNQRDDTPSEIADDPITNPSTLLKERSAQVCGQCHSVSDLLHPDLNSMENGHGYRPGDDLNKTHGVWSRDSPEFERTKETLQYDDIDTLLDETFYSDGMVRVSGREYNGLIQSECYLNGEMTCLSCHKMHQSVSDTRPAKEWANDQLSPEHLGNHACTQCHSSSQYDSRHTHHAEGSSGSSCYNCHMPHTTFGLLKAIRSHQISSPDVERDHGAKRPNACNQCHLAKTLQWTAGHLHNWYDIAEPELSRDEQKVAASLLWLVKGNAAERAISAWCMGWDDAQQTSGDDWQLPFLAAALDDDYNAVRLIARRSIQSIPGHQSFQLDVVTSSNSQQRQESAMKLWQEWTRTTKFEQDRPALLTKKGIGVEIEKVQKLIDQRDNSRILLSE